MGHEEHVPPGLGNRPSRCWGPVIATGVLHAALLLVYLFIYRGESSAFVCADAEKIGSGPFHGVRVGFHSQGFDGQFYYVLAQNPWLNQAE